MLLRQLNAVGLVSLLARVDSCMLLVHLAAWRESEHLSSVRVESHLCKEDRGARKNSGLDERQQVISSPTAHALNGPHA
jgi:hypothetical protein